MSFAEVHQRMQLLDHGHSWNIRLPWISHHQSFRRKPLETIHPLGHPDFDPDSAYPKCSQGPGNHI